jgi:hypothetical protein
MFSIKLLKQRIKDLKQIPMSKYKYQINATVIDLIK